MGMYLRKLVPHNMPLYQLIDRCRYIFQDVIFLKGIGMNKKYIVRLTAKERQDLATMTKKGKTQAYRIKHANIGLSGFAA